MLQFALVHQCGCYVSWNSHRHRNTQFTLSYGEVEMERLIALFIKLWPLGPKMEFHFYGHQRFGVTKSFCVCVLISVKTWALVRYKSF